MRTEQLDMFLNRAVDGEIWEIWSLAIEGLATYRASWGMRVLHRLNQPESKQTKRTYPFYPMLYTIAACSVTTWIKYLWDNASFAIRAGPYNER